MRNVNNSVPVLSYSHIYLSDVKTCLMPFTWVPFLPAGHPEDCFYLRVVGEEGNQSKLSVFSASFMGCPQLFI